MIKKDGAPYIGNPVFFLKVSDFICLKEPSFASIAVGVCEIMKVCMQLSVK